MVQGINDLKLRFASLTRQIERELKPLLEKQAKSIVAQMNATKPLPEIQIGWVWGPPPPGVLGLGRVARERGAGEYISIFARGFTSKYPSGDGFPAIARWFEFGTAPRFQEKRGNKYVGQITAQPYFFPVYRANAKRVYSAIRRKVNQVAKNA